MSKQMLKVCASSYDLKPVWGSKDFTEQVEAHLQAASEEGAQVLLLPEFLTTQLLTIASHKGLARQYSDLPFFDDFYFQTMSSLAQKYHLHVIAGTHPFLHQQKLPGIFFNNAYLFTSQGQIHSQSKIHPTPFEREHWQIDFTNALTIFEIEGVKAAILICYDIEFPELARKVREAGVDVIFCPTCTSDSQGYARVSICARARAIENQCYVVMAGTVGSLSPRVAAMSSNYGCAAVWSPSDGPFQAQGVLVQGELNRAQNVVASLSIADLEYVRQQGAVLNWQDRLPSLYPAMPIKRVKV